MRTHLAHTRADIDMQPVTRKRSVTWHAMTQRTQQSIDGVVGSPVYAQPARSTSPRYEEVLEMVRGWTEAEEHGSAYDAHVEGEPANDGYAFLNTSQSNVRHRSGGSSAHGDGERASTTAKRNPWGNESYSELITLAIVKAPRQRATLAQSMGSVHMITIYCYSIRVVYGEHSIFSRTRRHSFSRRVEEFRSSQSVTASSFRACAERGGGKK